MKQDTTEAEIMQHPRERVQFAQMLLSDELDITSGSEFKGNTSYEELVCVSYQPQLNRLDAVVALKKASGYSGGICSAGSKEYVKFFLSVDDGASWSELGTTSFTAWDVPGPKPLRFDVTLPVDLSATCCKHERIVRIRAVLSWHVPPAGADDPVVWGNSLDVHVQVAPLKFGTLTHMFDCFDFPIAIDDLAAIMPIDQVVEFGNDSELSPSALHKLYRESRVPAHRYLFSHVLDAIDDPDTLLAAMKKPGSAVFSELDVDITSILQTLNDPQGNQSFEQLGCVGLNPSDNELVATIDIKHAAGYGGNLCSKGSTEYVAFWADSGSGLKYVGTTAVNVHDIASIPSDGLKYTAMLPYPQAMKLRQPCGKGPKLLRIRAVLSWGSKPSTIDPFAVPYWGGHLETNVLLSPGVTVTGAGPILESIGNVALIGIDPSGRSSGRPFGAGIGFSGMVWNDTGLPGGPGIQYRMMITPNLGATPVPMTTPFNVVVTHMPSNVQTYELVTPDANGWCDYLTEITPGASTHIVQDYLGAWGTYGDGALWVSMEARKFGIPLGVPTPLKKIKLDNTAPKAAVSITSGLGSCGDFKPGDMIMGTYSASDDQGLSGVGLAVQMSMGPTVLVEKVPGTVVTTATTESGEWRLQTLPTTQPCGYTIVVTAVDKTINGSGGWWTQDFTGLCLRPAS